MTLLARGNYHYWLNDELQPVTEPWQINQTDKGWRLSGQRMLNGEALMNVEAAYQGLTCTRMQLEWFQGEKRALQYLIDGEALRWREKQNQSIPLPENCFLYPLLRAATGPIIQLLTKAPHTLVLPNLRDPNDKGTFLSPLLSERSAETVDVENRHYRYYGGEYGRAGSDYWLNNEAVVERYRWDSPQGVWDVKLVDYVASDIDFSTPGSAE